MFRRRDEEESLTYSNLYDSTVIDGDDEDSPGPHSLLMRMYSKINFWALTATVLFICFMGMTLILTVRMWIPQELSDIEGYGDNVPSKDLERIICRKAERQEQIIIPEAEINRYLRDTCQLRQDGFFSIFAQGKGVAFRLHDGYAELVIDRVFGRDSHQTASVNITFEPTTTAEGKPDVKVHLQGGSPILGSIPRGGKIGSLPIPKRHMFILQPALESLLGSYSVICNTLLKHGYCPTFEEGRVILTPQTYSPSSPIQ